MAPATGDVCRVSIGFEMYPSRPAPRIRSSSPFIALLRRPRRDGFSAPPWFRYRARRSGESSFGEGKEGSTGAEPLLPSRIDRFLRRLDISALPALFGACSEG